MRSHLRLLLAILLATTVALGLTVTSAQAAGIPKVSKVSSAGQDWYNAKLKIRWKAVSGATYQVRWAASKSGLGRATPITATSSSTSTSTLSNRCVAWYVQVRALKAGKVGAWSKAKKLKFKNKAPAVAKTSTGGQTSTTAAKVSWSYTSYAAKYRLRWSAAPYGLWKGYDKYTSWFGKTARSVSINLPKTPAAKDRFLSPAYGNPIFGQLQTNNGCTRTTRQTPFFPVFSKPRDPGTSATGYGFAIGSYNVELFPTSAKNATKINNLADNIAARNLDAVLLQEATFTTASNIASRLASGEGQSGWKVVTAGDDGYVGQQILYRSSKFTVAGSGLVGQRKDSSLTTPLLTPWARLTPVAPATGSQDVLVVSAHLESSSSTSIPTKKKSAHDQSAALLRELAAKAPTGIPTIVGGDLLGSFGAYCDENSEPACVGEGQPTFVRAGYWDAQSAVTKVGLKYSTVNKHATKPAVSKVGVGGRADYLLFKGFTGIRRYENVNRVYGKATSAYQSDHNLITASVYVPFLSTP
ncbi:endonuclease/exonuclease/phosphatase family metal-dependent hydrolase [Marmoricola sp. OAE513]|uniref:endonuclease/exonuclease/phosphatase family protein n=1 Tax=Marmoricola sp. OAE513 TaxID=2817894 RepID=UPI001AEAC3D9